MDIQQFEKELISKLQFKASSRVGVETVLLKIFKFFDLTNEGILRKPEFFKAIAKAGVTLSEQDISERLWQAYSINDVVNYREFIQKVVQRDQGDVNQDIPPQNDYKTSQIQQNNQPSVLDSLRAKVQLKGALGLLNLAISLPQQFNSQQLNDHLQRNGIDIDNLYQLFQGEYMSISNLINLIKGNYLNQFRQTLVANVYYTFEQGQNGVTPQYLTNRFHVERHPEIKILGRVAEDLREEFFTGLGMYMQIRGIKSFTLTDFFDFYSYLGFYLQNDELFRSILTAVWDLDQQVSPQSVRQSVKQKLEFSPKDNSPESIKEKSRQGPPSVQSRQSVAKSGKSQQSQQSQLSATSKQVELIVQRIRNRLISRGARGFISLYRVGRILDADHDGMLNLSEFRRAIRDHKIEVTDQEIDLVFQYFDREVSGIIDLWGFMYVLRGEMSQQRIQLVEQLFEKYRFEEYVQVGTLKQNFLVRNHPDLRSGKKNDDEIIADFFEPLLLLHNINGGFGNENISKEELVEFFSNYSASIPDDKYFEQILISVFRLTAESTKQHHAGNKQVFEPDHKRSYLQDHHRYVIQGGSVSQNAPFGTSNQNQELQQLQQQSSRPQTAYVQPSSFNIFKPLDDQKSKLGESQISQISQQPQPQAQQIHYPIEQTPKSKKMDSFQVLKNKILQRGIRGLIGIQLRFQLFDKANLGALSYMEWIQCFKQWRLDVNDNVLQEVFNQHQSNGMMIYDSFIKALQGTMSLKKFNVVQQCYENIPKQTVEAIKNQFNVKDHTEVRCNRRREEDVLCEFIDTFEQHHQVFTGSDYIRNPNVVFEEFIGYHNNLSAFIEDDTQFEQLLTAIWQLRRRL